MADDLAPLSFYERIARLEERMGSLIALLDEIRRDQRDLADTVARASGGMRMLLLLGGWPGLPARCTRCRTGRHTWSAMCRAEARDRHV